MPNDGVTSAEKTHGLAKEAERTAVEEASWSAEIFPCLLRCGADARLNFQPLPCPAAMLVRLPKLNT